VLFSNVFEDLEICNQIGDFYLYYLQRLIRLTDILGSGPEQENSDLNFALVKCYHGMRKS